MFMNDNAESREKELRIHRAAELRAAGMTWSKVAEELECDEEILRHECEQQGWDKRVRKERVNLLGDAAGESIYFLRRILRKGEEKNCFNAASCLLKLFMTVIRHGPRGTAKQLSLKAQKEMTQPSSAGIRFAKYVESLTPDQLSNLIRDLGYTRVPKQDSPPPSLPTVPKVPKEPSNDSLGEDVNETIRDQDSGVIPMPSAEQRTRCAPAARLRSLARHQLC